MRVDIVRILILCLSGVFAVGLAPTSLQLFRTSLAIPHNGEGHATRIVPRPGVVGWKALETSDNPQWMLYKE